MSKSIAMGWRGFTLKNAAIAVLLIAAAIGSTTMVVQAQSGGEIEIRITAQRLEDGRTEFAIQQREGDAWSDRIAPSARFLPAESPLDRWLSSTPVTIAAPAMLQTESGGGVEVRITAQRLEDGRTEFAIQQREGAGWSDRIAPRARFLPAEPPLDRWLSSTPVTIAAPTTIVDDHGNDIDDATAAAVGADVEGVVDYEGDVDVFRFTAEEGQLYQIDVALGTLPDSYLKLLDSDGWSLASNDDHGDSLASRIVWEAPASGNYYLAVEASGFDADVGAYTLTVSHSTTVDDHGNDIDDATAVVAVTVLPLPSDLVVDTPSSSLSTPMTGQSLTLNVTVRNRGNGSSDPAALRFYRSTDSNITSDDTDVGTVAVAGLDASGSSYESISLTAPSTPGTYYYGACVNYVSGESDTANNCSDAVALTVLPLPSDLVVDTPSSSLSTPMAGASLTLNVTVWNRGDGSSDPTTLRFYRSTDSTITSGDT